MHPKKKKMFAHCFPAGNYGIIKYIRIPARSLNLIVKKYTTWSSVIYTVLNVERQKITLHAYSDPLSCPGLKVNS